MSLRAVSVVVHVVALSVGFAAGGTTWSAFSGAATSAGNTFTAAASFAPELVQQLGTTSCDGGESSIAVPAGGAAAGHTVVVTLSLRGTTDGPVTVTDSRGNTYVQDAEATNANVRLLVFSGRLDTALAPGDVITASHPFSDDAQGMAAAEFRGIGAATRVDDVATAAGNGATAAASVTTQDANRLLVAAVANPNHRVYSDDAGWSPLADVSADCGGGLGRATLHSAHRLASSGGPWPYGTALNVPDRWAAAVVAYTG